MIRHGSQDSLDKDIYIVLDSPVDNIQKCKEICETYIGYNTNLVVITNGIVTWCYKGTIDEVNNSILATYDLHIENTLPCPIKTRVQRDEKLKALRTIRGILSYMSRTSLRPIVKEALKSEDMKVKINALKQINLEEIESFGKKGTNIEVYKFLAFQLVQTCMLYLGNEVFTKQDVRDLFPSLSDIIDRKEDNQGAAKLQELLNTFISKLEKDYIWEIL